VLSEGAASIKAENDAEISLNDEEDGGHKDEWGDTSEIEGEWDI
jgi:hypothetical protein